MQGLGVFNVLPSNGVAVSAVSLVATTKAISAPTAHKSIAVMKGVRVASYASANAAPMTPAKAYCRTPSNEETDPACGRALHNEREARVFRIFLGGLCVWL